MPTTVLARKHRSRDFASLVGQDHVVRSLANALAQQRLHHAYLFTGTRGVGKTSVARILAKALNCSGPDGQGGITAEPCGVCAACREIDAGRFVDYVELDAASNRTVEEMTQLLEQAVYKPVAGRFKVFLIDEVHMLSGHAFNAMLKTLEEPPDYLKFVLATTDPQKVPATVLSRCLQFNLRPMALPVIVAHLERVLAAEQVGFDATALKLIARAARGSMRDALSIADQAIAFGDGAVREDAVRGMLGAVDRTHATRIVDAVAAADGRALVDAVDGLRGLGLSAAGTLEELLALLQEMAVVQAVPDALDADEPGHAETVRLAAALPADETQLLYGIALAGRAELPLAPDEYSGLLMLLLRMLAFPPQGDDAQRARPGPARPIAAPAAIAAAAGARVPGRVSAPDSEVIVARAEEAAPKRASDAAPDRALADRWDALVRRLGDSGAIAALVRELAMQAECLGIAADGERRTVRLRVERENLRAPALQGRLQAALEAALGGSLSLEVEAGVARDTPAERAAAERARRQAEAEKTIEDDPLVRALLSQYKTARIVPGSVRPL